MTRSIQLSRHRGAALTTPRHRLDGPVAQEIRAGLSAVAAEVRRMVARVKVHRELRSIDREEARAVREVNWLRDELVNQERNLAWLEREYRDRRKALNARLHALGRVAP
ncbi:hypothetical protein [Cupriavidus gilardii]|uniref:hypothetical protein n=1 Tax=Cupriavidus gilardii TaxID=82541 RepID=UPI0015735D85|nr:hypothetical protein [Cupriavidus gilardii]NSX04833.1 hypothetical protein [Cupriavidus gilardii]